MFVLPTTNGTLLGEDFKIINQISKIATSL